MRFHFIAERDNDSGELGWKDRRIGWNGPYGPSSYARALAHDCLEHFSLSEVSDEIEAHAAIYWGRFQGGGVVNLQSIGAEWYGMAHALMSEHELRMPPRTRKLEDDVEEDISSIIIHGRKTMREEFSYTGNEFGWLSTANQIEKAFRGWFRIGYRKTAKRWARWNYSPAEVSYLFDQLEAEFQKFLPHKREEIFEGAQLTVKITKNGGIYFHLPEWEVY